MKTRRPRTPAALAGGQAEGPRMLTPGFFSPWGEPALVASMPTAWGDSAEGREGDRRWQGAKESLARFLVEPLLERQVPDLALDSDPLGKPRLWLGAAPGPALSFSWSAGRLWGAVGRSEGGLGLDAAAPVEFAGSYPHHLVFTAAEWQAALTLAGEEVPEAAALLWSVKEALVKARGCGFHFLSPKEVEVHFAGREGQGYLWRSSLADPGRNRDLPKGEEPCLAVSVRLQEVWLAVAWCR